MFINKYVFVATAIFASLGIQSAQASTFNFYKITNNSSSNLGNQLSMEVTEVSGGATFKFKNDIGISSNVATIYFDVRENIFSSFSISGQSEEVANGTNTAVSFTQGGSITPGNLPGGSSITPSFIATTDYSADANNPAPKNGLNESGDWITFLGIWASGNNLDELIEAMEEGDFRVGLHVTGIGRESDSYINNPTPPAVPLPAAAWLFGSALIGFVTLSNRRKV